MTSTRATGPRAAPRAEPSAELSTGPRAGVRPPARRDRRAAVGLLVAGLGLALLTSPSAGADPRFAPAVASAGQPARVSAGSTDPYLAASVPRARGCIRLGAGWAGVKVYLVQRRLGTTADLDRYLSTTRDAVARFQRRHGLPVTGRVDRSTWRLLGTGRPFCLDRFTVQPSVGLDATPRERIDAMLGWAGEQVGRRYVWSGAGRLGYDCSGLALQGLHAGGLVLPSVTTWDHQHSAFPTAAAIRDSGLQRLPLAERRRGDLVFFGPAGTVTHMALYLGRDRVVEAVRPRVRLGSLWGHDVPVKRYVVRPFPRG